MATRPRGEAGYVLRPGMSHERYLCYHTYRGRASHVRRY